MATLIDFIIHIDVHLVQIIDTFGLLSYLIVFAIIFAETGFVFTPFLPGDSLLFAVGALAAIGSFNIFVMVLLLVAAAFLGDTSNYWIGHFFGDRIIDNKRVPIKRAYIDQTQAFFQKHGGKTIVLARFVPIVRTFAPFVAGIGKMSYARFISFNIVGGVLWVALFTLAGYFFGNIPAVKHNFSLVIMAIVAISIVPMIIASLRERNKTSAA